ncbi:hypothetical protein FACS189490_00230 [Clostridia bacterium]|nr:hypothetical protein FACS189490_00230 [Clostridia bacterium]
MIITRFWIKGNFNLEIRTISRWAVAQIILRIKVDPTKYNYIYGIAMPLHNIKQAIGIIRGKWTMKHLKIRLYDVYYDSGKLTAKEYLPKEIYG